MARDVTGVALCTILLAAGPAVAEPRTPVTVAVVVVEYRNDFADVRALEREAAARIAGRLGRHLGFLRFTPAPGAPFMLTFEVKAKAPPERPGAPREVGFHIRLEGPGVRESGDYLVFRGEDEFGRPIGDVPAMAAEIDLKLRDDDLRGRLAKLLRQIPIARSAHVWRAPPPVGWILPYRRGDLCVDFHSQFVIETVVLTAVGPSRVELEARAAAEFLPPDPTPVDRLRGHIFTRPLDEARFQAELGGAAQASVEAIRLKEYRALAGCGADFGR
jgi:hypothetical protein